MIYSTVLYYICYIVFSDIHIALTNFVVISLRIRSLLDVNFEFFENGVGQALVPEFNEQNNNDMLC